MKKPITIINFKTYKQATGELNKEEKKYENT